MNISILGQLARTALRSSAEAVTARCSGAGGPAMPLRGEADVFFACIWRCRGQKTLVTAVIQPDAGVFYL